MSNTVNNFMQELENLLDKYDFAIYATAKEGHSVRLGIQQLFPIIRNMDLGRDHITAYDVRLIKYKQNLSDPNNT